MNQSPVNMTRHPQSRAHETICGESCSEGELREQRARRTKVEKHCSRTVAQHCRQSLLTSAVAYRHHWASLFHLPLIHLRILDCRRKFIRFSRASPRESCRRHLRGNRPPQCENRRTWRRNYRRTTAWSPFSLACILNISHGMPRFRSFLT